MLHQFFLPFADDFFYCLRYVKYDTTPSYGLTVGLTDDVRSGFFVFHPKDSLMIIDDKIFRLFSDVARRVTIEHINIGISYTAVTLSDGGIGLAYTYLDGMADNGNEHQGCFLQNTDYEGKKAIFLLEKIYEKHPLYRSMAMALVNALNYRQALNFPEDLYNRILFDEFLPKPGMNVAMVGFFKPMLSRFKERDANLEIIDKSHRMGNEDDFYPKLKSWADVLFLTSTTILNNTMEEILSHAGGTVKTVMLGPSTPMIPEAFDHLPIHMLAGTVPVDQDGVLKAIRNGKGTKIIHQFSRKSYITL